MRRLIAALALALLPAIADAKDYTAEQFDSRVEVLPGGSLRIVETIVVRFEEGTFTFFYRTIPTRRTDGVEFVSASMDGRAFPAGDQPGQVEVRRNNGLRVEWHFAPTRASTHTFRLTYLARGVGELAQASDVLAWRAVPSRHDYRIESSRVELVLPARPLGEPTFERHRVESLRHTRHDQHIVVTAHGIGKNGWFEFWTTFPKGTVVAAPPEWQQRELRHAELRMPSALVAGLLFLVGLAVLFALHQNYDRPPGDVQPSRTFAGPPDSAPPAIAGALTSNGQLKLEHAMGALFALASHGVLTIHEAARGALGTRKFTIARGPSTRELVPHERSLVEGIFSATAASGHEVPLDKARTHLARHFSQFKRIVEQEMRDASLLDAGRQSVRRHYNLAGVVVLMFAGILAIPLAVFAQRLGGWPFLVPGILATLGMISFVLGAAHTPLSNEGVRRAAAWRGYRKQLRQVPKDVAGREWMRHPLSPSDLVPLAVALGLAGAWSKIFKDGASPLPPWFHAASAADAHRGFVAFVGHGGAGASGGGGAAGGGGSGAG